MRFVLMVLSLCAAMSSTTVYADTPHRVLVELFTSQGCSMSRSANSHLGELAKRNDVLALTFHVNYWDYLGWKDTFAHDEFVKRQKKYIASLSSRKAYTPQMVINGLHDVVGSKINDVNETIRGETALNSLVRVSSQERGSRMEVTLASKSGSLAKAADVFAVYYIPSAVVEVTSGENAGQRLVFSNVVTRIRNLGKWSGTTNWTHDFSAPEGLKTAIIVQLVDQGPVLTSVVLK